MAARCFFFFFEANIDMGNRGHGQVESEGKSRQTSYITRDSGKGGGGGGRVIPNT